MIDGKRIAAVIVAAGKGLRMGREMPKQYLPLASECVLSHTVRAFERSAADDIVLVCPAGDEDFVKTRVLAGRFLKVRAVTAGGKERFESSYAGIKAVCELRAELPDIILIHDGVRALITPELIDSVAAALSGHPAVCPGVSVKETIRQIGDGGISVSVPERGSLRAIQTPQGFEAKLIVEAYERFFEDIAKTPEAAEGVTDDAMLVERYMRQPVFVAEGSYENIKITTPEDLLLAEGILGKRV